MKLPPIVTDPKLIELLEKARDYVMTPEEVRAQRISFVYGQMMDCAPELTREKVAEIHDSIYGKTADQS